MELSSLFKSWKQPIPTNLDAVFGEDYLAQEIFIFALLHATNEEHVVNRNGKFTKLQRGQCYATITHLAERFGKDRETINRALERLGTVYNALHNKVDHFGVVMTIQSYDEIIKLHNDTRNNSSMNPQTTLNNSPMLPQRTNINNNVKNNKQIKKKKFFNNISQYPKLANITDEVMEELAEQYNVSFDYVQNQKENLRIYCESNGKKYHDYKAALENFIRRDKNKSQLQPQDNTNDMQGETLEEVKAKAEQDMADLDQIAEQQGL